MTHTKFLTYSGKLFDYRNMKAEDICLEDIAHHLTNTQRFGGCLPLNTKFSVASHSLNCYQIAKFFEPHDTLLHKACLLHDATEAYLGDVVSGLKKCLPEYEKLETELSKIIFAKYIKNHWNISLKHVDMIDKRMMLTEAYHLTSCEKYRIYKEHSKWYRLDPHSMSKYDSRINENWKIKPDKYPEHIKQLFLNTCEMLGIREP